MSDSISRKAAIDALCDNCDHVRSDCPHYPCRQYISIRQLPSADNWIPVSERLPEGYEEILICDKQGNISTGGYLGGERPFEDNYGYYMDEVIAWQPMPEPYKGGEQ